MSRRCRWVSRPGRPVHRAVRRAVAAVGILAVPLALSTAGCGIPTEQAPRSIDVSASAGLLASPKPARPSPSTTPNPSGPRVYFIDDTHGRLVGIPRPVSHRAPREMLATLMHDLSTGLTEDERDRGLGSALPPGLTLTVSELHDGQATVNLSGDVPAPSGEKTVLAVAQVVLSATTVPTVLEVVLTRAGDPLEAPKIGGALTSDPLVRADYQPLLR